MSVGIMASSVSSASPAISPGALPGLIGWWDPGDVASLTVAGGKVSSLADASSAGHNLIQPNAQYQPTVTTFGPNTGLLFDASVANCFLYTNPWLVDCPQPWTIIIAGKSYDPNPAPKTRDLIQFWSVRMDQRLNAAESRTSLYAGIRVAGVLSDSLPHVWTFVGDGASSKIQVDQTAPLTADAGTLGLVVNHQFQLSSSTSGWNGLIGGVAVYNRVLTAPEFLGVQQFMKERWGTT